MNSGEGQKLLESLVMVTPQRVTIAKAFMLKNFNISTRVMLDDLLQASEASMPARIVLHPSGEPEGTIKKAAEAISWTLAGHEGIWGLISAGLLIPLTTPWASVTHSWNLHYTTIGPSGSGESSSWNLDHFSLPIPSKVYLSRTLASRQDQPLSDPDLFLHTMNISNMHDDVKESLREAVRCFRHELYLACLTLLGKASEGAWTELGRKLIAAVPAGAEGQARKILENPFTGIANRIATTVRLYGTEHCKTLRNIAKVTDKELQLVAIWADGVRESRNSVHYEVQPSMPNTYEKVAALLIGAVPHLRLIYRIDAALT